MADTPEAPTFTVASLLRATPALAEVPGLVATAERIFDYAQFLLDADENLTRTGALNGEARALLQKRVAELLGEGADEEAP